MPRNLKDTLKEIQILLGKPHKRIAGAFKYYLSFLNVKESSEKNEDAAPKEEKIQAVNHGKITWVDVKNPTRKEISELAQKYPFHPLHLEDCVSKSQFPKIEQNDEDRYIFILLRFPSLNISDQSISMNQLCFFLGHNYLVTIHENENSVISKIFEDCKDNEDRRKAYIGNSSSHLLYTIIEQLTEGLSPLRRAILTEGDLVEDIVFDDKVSGVYQVGQLRRKIISLRRVIGPLRALLADMSARVTKFSKSNLSVYYTDITHRVDRTWETLEEARETVDIYKDADFTINTEKTNTILSVLTIIFTLSIPATIVGTFYGMNILLPGGIEGGSWTFFGTYTTLIIIMILATIPALLMYLYFRKKGWF